MKASLSFSCPHLLTRQRRWTDLSRHRWRVWISITSTSTWSIFRPVSRKATNLEHLLSPKTKKWSRNQEQIWRLCGKWVIRVPKKKTIQWFSFDRQAMELQVDQGRAKSIGISNFNSQQIERVVKASRIMPVNLQVEMHAYFQQKPLRAVCAKHGITVCAYAPLGSAGRFQATDAQGKPWVNSLLVKSEQSCFTNSI